MIDVMQKYLSDYYFDFCAPPGGALGVSPALCSGIIPGGALGESPGAQRTERQVPDLLHF